VIGDVVLNGLVSAQGGGPLVQTGSGGCGGTLSVAAHFGTLTVVGGMQAEGAQGTQAGGDGDGGSITLCSVGSMFIQKNSPVSARSNGPQGYAGTICVEVGLNLSVQSLLDISGGGGSSEIDICVGTDVTLGQSAGTIIDARGRGADSGGGTVNIQAALVADNGPGTIDIFGTVDSSGDPGNLGFGDGVGGTVVMGGCNVKIELSGAIISRGPTGGENDLTGNESISIFGRLDATQIGANGTSGTNSLEYPSRNPPILAGVIVPPVGVLVRVTPAAPGVGYVIGDVLNIVGGTGGQATVTQVTNNTITGVEIAAPGANYRVNDIIRINGGSGGTLAVTAVDNGAVTGLRLVNGGSGYTVSNNQSTNNFGGPGTGFTVNITSVASTGVIGVSLRTGGTGYGTTNGTPVTGGNGSGATLDIVAGTTLNADATCTAEMPDDCLPPCPTCGNGIVEYPETCDNGTALNCQPASLASPMDCTSYCQVITPCDDADPCTIDTCDPVLGCNRVPNGCVSPTQTPAITPPPTNTPPVSPDGTPTPERTPTRSPTVNPPPTPSPSAATDANCDGADTAADVTAVVQGLGSAPVCDADIDHDGTVDTTDITLAILQIFGD